MRLKTMGILAMVPGLASLAHACLWLHGTTIDGVLGDFTGDFRADQLAAVIFKNPASEPRFFENYDYRPNDPVAKANDAAVQQLMHHNAAQAVAMLKDTEKQHPGIYFTAANLGTAYELSGDDENALKWILEGIKRNPRRMLMPCWPSAMGCPRETCGRR